MNFPGISSENIPSISWKFSQGFHKISQFFYYFHQGFPQGVYLDSPPRIPSEAGTANPSGISLRFTRGFFFCKNASKDFYKNSSVDFFFKNSCKVFYKTIYTVLFWNFYTNSFRNISKVFFNILGILQESGRGAFNRFE